MTNRYSGFWTLQVVVPHITKQCYLPITYMLKGRFTYYEEWTLKGAIDRALGW